jgi:hypothetical protein
MVYILQVVNNDQGRSGADPLKRKENQMTKLSNSTKTAEQILNLYMFEAYTGTGQSQDCERIAHELLRAEVEAVEVFGGDSNIYSAANRDLLEKILVDAGGVRQWQCDNSFLMKLGRSY